MKWLITLKKVETGEAKTIEWDDGLVELDNTDDSENGVRYIWEDGNMACDCNRSDQFNGGFGMGDYDCGHDKMKLEKIVNPKTGKEVELYNQ
jgi:hypothetical protein